MGFLDKVKDTAGKAAEKVAQAAESGQEKLEEQKTKKKVGDLKEELGGVVYAQRIGSAPENAEAEIARIVGEIQAAEATLEGGDDQPEATGADSGSGSDSNA